MQSQMRSLWPGSCLHPFIVSHERRLAFIGLDKSAGRGWFESNCVSLLQHVDGSFSVKPLKQKQIVSAR